MLYRTEELGAEFIKANAARIAELRGRRKRRLPEHFAVNHTWALDLTFIRAPGGIAATVLGILDQGS